MTSINVDELLQLQRQEEFTLLDVRLREVKTGAPLSIAGATWQDPEHVGNWIEALPKDKSIVVFCAHGRSISQGITKQLNEYGLRATYLEGGLAAWIEKGNIIV